VDFGAVGFYDFDLHLYFLLVGGSVGMGLRLGMDHTIIASTWVVNILLQLFYKG
jgi:hypothetical protein